MEQIHYDELWIEPLTKRHELISFDSNNSELNDFLKNDAFGDQENMTSRTYLCFWDKSIAGYLTLVADTLEVEAVDKSDKIDGYPYRKYPAIKIARLAVDRRLEKRGVGRYILLAAIGKAISVSNDIGCRYITVDSKPESTVFYDKHNFKMVEKYRHSEFPKMYLNMYPIVATMRTKESLKQFEN
ncbi:MAG: GNAT family N-acetyltransferase [Candidatus Methanoperedens sp.]|nr:GNAT family N-acetyltransferase [Candidatus Methanoperedens sp.]